MSYILLFSSNPYKDEGGDLLTECVIVESVEKGKAVVGIWYLLFIYQLWNYTKGRNHSGVQKVGGII